MRFVRKFILCFAVGVAFFSAGWFVAKNDFLGSHYQTALFMERNNARIEKGWHECTNGDVELTLENAEFLQEHLFGKWKVKGPAGVVDSIFNEQSVREMESIEITFAEDSVEMGGFDQNTFSDPQIMFIYLEWGGSKKVNLPVYYVVRKEDKECLPKPNLARLWWEDGNERFPHISEMIYIGCDLGTPYNSHQVSDSHLGQFMWIDPDDTDKLYFLCWGFWEMERVE